MRTIAALMLCLCAALASEPSVSALRVFACEPEWGALTNELGGERVNIYTATTALQDPHLIQARPSLIARVRRADLVVCSGAELEAAWLPVLLRRGNNPKVQPGTPGFFEAYTYVEMLEIPLKVDRAEGDIHALGNPHIQTDPRNILKVAQALSERLIAIDPDHAGYFTERYEAFDRRWTESINRWEKMGQALRGVKVVSDHKAWPYLYGWVGLAEVATLEPKPGIPPSAGHLARVLGVVDTEKARMIVRAAYQDSRPAKWLAARSGLPIVELPFTVGGVPGADDLFGLFDVTMQRLVEAVQ